MGKEKNTKEDEAPTISMSKENFQYFEADRISKLKNQYP